MKKIIISILVILVIIIGLAVYFNIFTPTTPKTTFPAGVNFDNIGLNKPTPTDGNTTTNPLVSTSTNVNTNTIQNTQTIPYYVITIHVNPVNVKDPGSAIASSNLLDFYNNTKAEVAYANKYNMKLSLWISAVMADYISQDPIKLAEAKNWMTQGHEIGLHHHSTYRDTDWDGYTSLSKTEALAVRKSLGDNKDNYKGTLEDLVAIIKRINPNVKSGVNSEQSHVGEAMPKEIIYSTGSGYLNYGTPGVFSESDSNVAVAVNEFISSATINGIQRKWLRHFNIGTKENVLAAEEKYNVTNANSVFSVITHNSEANVRAAEAFMDFLHSKDATGKNSKTVSQIMESNLLPVKGI